jgi:hypothetical protein
MAIDWSTVEQTMIAAIEGVIGGAWSSIASGTIAGIKALSTVAQQIVNATDLNADIKRQLILSINSLSRIR